MDEDKDAGFTPRGATWSATAARRVCTVQDDRFTEPLRARSGPSGG
jgi:hypothetical protein